MDPKVAVKMFYSLIEQTMANGAFKKIAHLDELRAAYDCLNEFVNPKIKPDEKTIEKT